MITNVVGQIGPCTGQHGMRVREGKSGLCFLILGIGLHSLSYTFLWDVFFGMGEGMHEEEEDTGVELFVVGKCFDVVHLWSTVGLRKEWEVWLLETE